MTRVSKVLDGTKVIHKITIMVFRLIPIANECTRIVVLHHRDVKMLACILALELADALIQY